MPDTKCYACNTLPSRRRERYSRTMVFATRSRCHWRMTARSTDVAEAAAFVVSLVPSRALHEDAVSAAARLQRLRQVVHDALRVSLRQRYHLEIVVAYAAGLWGVVAARAACRGVGVRGGWRQRAGWRRRAAESAVAAAAPRRRACAALRERFARPAARGRAAPACRRSPRERAGSRPTRAIPAQQALCLPSGRGLRSAGWRRWRGSSRSRAGTTSLPWWASRRRGCQRCGSAL